MENYLQKMSVKKKGVIHKIKSQIYITKNYCAKRDMQEDNVILHLIDQANKLEWPVRIVYDTISCQQARLNYNSRICQYHELPQRTST